ncbi:flavin containing amine oxidoreductase family protein [Asticcacaulis biprosthecium C19]|uniref:Tryptophan 2-monooxygenase n=1 Tax=Asticcacaulis biprosthecium C19 TaxID=715226 RepID=F4QL11_9CAUL|nr:NAD(P)/FAD-dependent oxidoreductase [Asticcacaulis biprosthecium]EGF92234.1 flavin containing amine oxidoreductase family protein [Asticcacaulis biprosthecium C19]
MTDVIIIGAGISGLSAALALKARGLSYTILEASGEIGGRAQTRRLPSGVPADLGPHWLHGEDSELGDLIRAYGLPGHRDASEAMRIYEFGQRVERGDDWPDGAVDPDTAKAVASGESQDVPLSGLGKDEEGRKWLRRFGQGWNGLEPPAEPSAYEFLTDESEPGGLQLDGGMAALVARMAEEVGRESIRLDTPVAQVRSVGGRVEVDGMAAGRAVVTVGLGVLNSGGIGFDPEVQSVIATATQGLVVSRMNKIILELDPGFLSDRHIPEDLGVLMVDSRAHYCHVRGGGLPLLTLFATGDAAGVVEGFSHVEALHYVAEVVKAVPELHDLKKYVVAEPIVTRWLANPWTQGAYSALMPGYRRHAPWWTGRVGICGDSFDDRFPASLAGAFRSGKRLIDALP